MPKITKTKCVDEITAKKVILEAEERRQLEYARKYNELCAEYGYMIVYEAHPKLQKMGASELSALRGQLEKSNGGSHGEKKSG